MPIYEYQCENCGETNEVLQKFSDAPLSQCPGCGGQMHKLMSMNSFQLKGNGWYVTDYAGKNSQATLKKDCEGKAGGCAAAATTAATATAAGPAESKSDSGCKSCCEKSNPPA